MSETVRGAECTPTLCVTAANLDRHPELAGDLAGLDLVIHGYEHVGYGALSPEAQTRDLSAACSAFETHGLLARGFRAPYLRLSASTYTVLRAKGFTFDSSQVRFVLPRDDTTSTRLLKQAELRYGHVQPVPQRPYVESGLIEIPVSLPDDELLIDALNIRKQEQLLRIFNAMLDATIREGAALILQVHPERFSLCQDAIRATLQHATDRGAWLASLTEIADWTRRTSGQKGRWPDGCGFAVAVTGDFDALCIPDFWGRLWAGST